MIINQDLLVEEEKENHRENQEILVLKSLDRIVKKRKNHLEMN